MQSYINGSTWFFQEVEINLFGSFPKSVLIYLWPMVHEIGKLCCHLCCSAHHNSSCPDTGLS